MFDRNVARNYYELNQRALRFRNSKEYFIGDRICRYLTLIKKLHLIAFFKLMLEDIWRVVYKKKRNPSVQTINFDEPYLGSKIAVYTVVYGKYDDLYEPLYKDPNCDYFIFTDQDIPEHSIWKKVEYLNFPKEVNSNFLKNRYLKILPHKIFENYRYSVYIDGNIQITSEISLYFKNFISNTGIAMHKHPSNKGIYEELKYNHRLGKITNDEVLHLKRLYRENNMPKNYGMFECNVICREHFDDDCIKIMEAWWDSVFHGVKRDQLYLTYVLYKLGYKFEDIKLIGENINANPMFIRYEHC